MGIAAWLMRMAHMHGLCTWQEFISVDFGLASDATESDPRELESHGSWEGSATALNWTIDHLTCVGREQSG